MKSDRKQGRKRGLLKMIMIMIKMMMLVMMLMVVVVVVGRWGSSILQWWLYGWWTKTAACGSDEFHGWNDGPSFPNAVLFTNLEASIKHWVNHEVKSTPSTSWDAHAKVHNTVSSLSRLCRTWTRQLPYVLRPSCRAVHALRYGYGPYFGGLGPEQVIESAAIFEVVALALTAVGVGSMVKSVLETTLVRGLKWYVIYTLLITFLFFSLERHFLGFLEGTGTDTRWRVRWSTYIPCHLAPPGDGMPAWAPRGIGVTMTQWPPNDEGWSRIMKMLYRMPQSWHGYHDLIMTWFTIHVRMESAFCAVSKPLHVVMWDVVMWSMTAFVSWPVEDVLKNEDPSFVLSGTCLNSPRT